jgi:hypothetical protein
MMTQGERWVFIIVFIALVLLAGYGEYQFKSAKFDFWGFAWLVFSAVVLAKSSIPQDHFENVPRPGTHNKTTPGILVGAK